MTGRGGEERGTQRRYTPDLLTELFRNPVDPSYAAAAARRRETGPAAGWRHLAERGASVLTLLLVGVLLAVAYLQTVADEPTRGKVREGLVSQIKQREARTGELQERADGLREEVARLRDAALDGGAASRLREVEAATGMARVRGSGVVVRVSDGPSKADAVTGAGGTNLGRVLDSDLQDIANGLWSAGAEAIAINGQRLTATSTIRAAGEAILVDFRPISGPYEVSAVGPDEMERRFRDSVVARLLHSLAADYGLGFQVRTVDELTLPAASAPQLRFAQPSPEATPSGSPPTSPAPSGPGSSPTSSGGGR